MPQENMVFPPDLHKTPSKARRDQKAMRGLTTCDACLTHRADRKLSACTCFLCAACCASLRLSRTSEVPRTLPNSGTPTCRSLEDVPCKSMLFATSRRRASSPCPRRVESVHAQRGFQASSNQQAEPMRPRERPLRKLKREATP